MEISSLIGLAITALSGVIIVFRVAFRVLPWPLPAKALLRLTYQAKKESDVWAVDPRLLMEGEALCQVYWLNTNTWLLPVWEEFRRLPPPEVEEDGSNSYLDQSIQQAIEEQTKIINEVERRIRGINPEPVEDDRSLPKWIDPKGVPAPFKGSRLDSVLRKHKQAVLREAEARQIWAASTKQIPMSKEG